MNTVRHLSNDELSAGLPVVAAAPSSVGKLEMVARRPATNERELVEQGVLSVEAGLEGDNWRHGKANPECQLTLMSSRAADLVAAGERDRWALAGDQLYVDFDLSDENLPAGTRVRIGAEAVVEVTAEPHTGCAKFIERFGLAAMKFVNSSTGRSLNLRGINTKIIAGGTIRVGDGLSKISP